MKPEHKDLNPTDLALLTWYNPDNELYRNPEHPTIKLAGEIGELLDLYGKHKYKPGFDWEMCKHCKHRLVHHHTHANNECVYADDKIYLPIVLDELGDIWYYLRILAWMWEIEFIDPVFVNPDLQRSIKAMYHNADNILNGGNHSIRKYEIAHRSQAIYECLVSILDNLDYTIEQLTLLNYYKLNSESTNHGWANAR